MAEDGPKAPPSVRRMVIGQTPVTKTLRSGEKITGWLNYTGDEGIDLILADETLRWIPASDLNGSSTATEGEN